MTRAQRAMQVWQILIAAAHSRRTLTYGQLANHLGFDGAGVFSQILGCIMNYCNSKQPKLPPLTCIVVNQDTGIPGTGLTTIANLPVDREQVYQYNWYAMFPIQVSDFEPFA